MSFKICIARLKRQCHYHRCFTGEKQLSSSPVIGNFECLTPQSELEHLGCTRLREVSGFSRAGLASTAARHVKHMSGWPPCTWRGSPRTPMLFSHQWDCFRALHLLVRAELRLSYDSTCILVAENTITTTAFTSVIVT